MDEISDLIGIISQRGLSRLFGGSVHRLFYTENYQTGKREYI